MNPTVNRVCAGEVEVLRTVAHDQIKLARGGVVGFLRKQLDADDSLQGEPVRNH